MKYAQLFVAFFTWCICVAGAAHALIINVDMKPWMIAILICTVWMKAEQILLGIRSATVHSEKDSTQ